jgi:hypothetical protein
MSVSVADAAIRVATMSGKTVVLDVKSATVLEIKDMIAGAEDLKPYQMHIIHNDGEELHGTKTVQAPADLQLVMVERHPPFENVHLIYDTLWKCWHDPAANRYYHDNGRRVTISDIYRPVYEKIQVKLSQ